ncbi:MAG TPA: hypothetical protein VJV03_18445 [Pyrinomonadaceae bacterium]|nr:hypothetical protein [Pyrinomonadaceae bacterium]
MNCQRFEDIVIDLARSVPMEASVRDMALAHCAGCDSCALGLSQQKSLTGGLKVFAAEMKSATAPDHVQQNLIAALRQQTSAPQSNQVSHSRRYLAVAAAVLVAVAMGIIGYKMMAEEPVILKVRHSPDVKPIAHTPPDEPPAQLVTTHHKPTPVVVKRQRPKKLRPNVSAQSTFVSVVVGSLTDETSEVASPFMAMGYTNPANMQEGAQVVRVELPRYAMARFGLPVNMERYDELVKADVWLGTDGVARAIRFVQ